MTSAASIRYRPEIDGLRALAVSAVIIFHYFEDWAPGGFLGVDLFFVLSGYLITKIILAEREAGAFNLWAFYARRVRRILPALFIVIAATLATSMILHPAEQLERVAVSALAALFFAANFHFRDSQDYFAVAPVEEPLLHTWSLSVEEQFYLVWPALLLALYAWRSRRGVVAGLLIVCALTWALSQYLSLYAVDLAFFMAPSRGWELGLGALSAAWLEPRFAQRGGARLRGGLTLVGLALIISAFVGVDRTWPTPGLSALPVVAGAMLVLIFGAARSIAHRALAWGPVVTIGLLSYSLYLWHWPVLSFAAGLQLGPTSIWLRLIALGITLVLAVISFRFIERPFRQAGAALPPRRTLVVGLAGAAAVAAIALIAVWGDGLPGRYPSASAALASYKVGDVDDPTRGACHHVLKFKPERCNLGAAKAGQYDVLLIGDSHAGAIRPAVSVAATALGLSGRQASVGACPPLLGVSMAKFGDRSFCSAFNTFWPQLIGANPKAKLIVLAARWSLYLEPLTLSGSRKRRFSVVDRAGQIGRGALTEAEFKGSLRDMIADLQRRAPDATILILGQARPHRISAVECVRAAIWNGASPSASPALCDAPRADAQTRVDRADRILQEIADSDARVHVVKLSDSFCDAERCRVGDVKGLYYFDDNHVTVYGAVKLARDRDLAAHFRAALAATAAAKR
ncbi:MAG: acyltransferase [Neomegalonema sp.]|nr:acyltransferase [Neomegalonema sp.]